MARQTEPNANNALGDLLRSMLPGCQVRSENTQTFPNHPGRHADVLITAPGRSPVVVEAEYEPAPEAERDAVDRLGLAVEGEPRTIEAAIALRYPQAVEEAYDVREAISVARHAYCVRHEDGSRFPESGWMNGPVSDLADLIRLVSVPQKAVEQAAETLEQGIEQAANRLEEMATLRPNVTPVIARLLGMSDVPQTRRMACAIIANAMVFHQRIAWMHEGVKPLRLVCGPDVSNPQGETLSAWAAILKINYWPIFAIAKDILEQIPGNTAASILRELLETAQGVEATGVDNAHDLTGRIFQRLIADRKYLATFYTLPASAALLARLAVTKMDGLDWSDAEAIGKLRIADFACGTGALLSAVYEQIAARHDRAGGDSSKLHPMMMEEVLYGCDVMPSAIHITGSTLSGAQPTVGFGSSRLYTVPYGRQTDGGVLIGSLELLRSSALLTLFNMSDPALRTGSVGEATASQILAEFPDEGYDLVIMNPPFTSDTKHRDSEEGVLNAAFAAFNASDEDQEDMAKRLKRLAKDTSYHGHAGLGSAFTALANRKVRPNGVIAFVLPFTAINGSSWSKFRELIAKHYTDVTIVSIAANGLDMSFSSDTDIGECLVIGRKLEQGEEPSGRGTFTSLRSRPTSFADAQELSKVIRVGNTIRRLEDGPFGGIPIYKGEAQAGEVLDAPLDSFEEGWGAARILDYSVAQVAHALTTGRLWLPAETEAQELPTTQLNHLGQRGVDHQFLVSTAHKAPFVKVAASPTSTYPALWNHDAKSETRMVCIPDSQMLVRPGMEAAAAKLWEIASRSHITQEFRFTSQPLAVAITDRESIGGRAWPNVIFPDPKFDSIFALWCNCTLGLLLFWWRSSRQQSGRGALTINGIESLPVLDFRTLSAKQLRMAEVVFSEFRDKDLKPAYLADADPKRALLDRRVVCDLLGFDEEIYVAVRRLAAKWCAEPSVHGGKPRPKAAKLVS